MPDHPNVMRIATRDVREVHKTREALEASLHQSHHQQKRSAFGPLLTQGGVARDSAPRPRLPPADIPDTGFLKVAGPKEISVSRQCETSIQSVRLI